MGEAARRTDSSPAARPDPLHAADPDAVDVRRIRTDRRRQPTPMFSKYTFFGRRRHNRRGDDPQKNYYVDWISGPYLRALIGIILLITADSLSTLHIISQGGSEANPLMRWFLERGTLHFLAAKLGTGLLGFLMLAVHRFFPIARSLVALLLLTYGALVLYHIALLTKIHF